MRNWIDLMGNDEHHFGRSDTIWTDPNDDQRTIRYRKGHRQELLGVFETDEREPAKTLTPEDIWNGEADTVLIVDACDLQRYGNRPDNLFEHAARYPTQIRWGGEPHPLFP